MCISAGEYLPETLLERWRARTGQVLYDGIGSTEAMHIFCSNRPSGYKPGTSGKPVDGYDLKIVDADGIEVPHSSVGRLLVRGKTLAKGYWNRHEANQTAFIGEWLATGDIYEKTEDGYFKYIGRQDDVFKVSGLWVSPGEIELALMSHGLVAEAAVIAVRGPTGTTSAKAFVVLTEGIEKRGEERIRQEIHAHLEGRLSKYKIPSQIEFLSALPKTATGKVSRAELRKRQTDRYMASAVNAG
jgi:4-hydroxybenzoate-CoA ligase